MAKHARFSPSMLDNLSRCIRFKYVERKDEDAADEGTMLHKAFETGNLVGLDNEQTQSVQSILDLVDSLKATNGGPSNWIELKEGKVMLEDLTFGTMDRALIHKYMPIAYVIDAKFTRRRSEHDMQLKTYAAALVEMTTDRKLEKVTTVIAAPRIGEPEMETFDAQQLLVDVRKWVTDLYARIDDPFNEPTPHEDLCDKCNWAHKCPKLNAVVKQCVISLGLPLPSVFDPSAMTSDQDRMIGQVIAGALANWAEQVKHNNAEYVKATGDGNTIPGFRLVSRSTGLRVNSELTPLAVSAIVTQLDQDEDFVLEHCTLAIGKLTKAIAEKTGRLESEIKEEIKTALSDMVQEGTAEYLTKTKKVTDTSMLLSISMA